MGMKIQTNVTQNPQHNKVQLQYTSTTNKIWVKRDVIKCK